MKTFEDLSANWIKQQPTSNPFDVNKIQHHVLVVNRKQRITVIVLLCTLLILVGYAGVTISKHHFWFDIGLVIMIGSLIYRLLLEIISRRKLDRLPISVDAIAYSKALRDYQKWRLRVHQIYTPIILVIYWLGFVLLLPTLKQYLSYFWFNYVWISSIPIAIVMSIFIAYHIKKERERLLELQSFANEMC